MVYKLGHLVIAPMQTYRQRLDNTSKIPSTLEAKRELPLLKVGNVLHKMPSLVGGKKCTHLGDSVLENPLRIARSKIVWRIVIIVSCACMITHIHFKHAMRKNQLPDSICNP